MTFTLLSSVYGLGWRDMNAMPIAAIMAYVQRIPNTLALYQMVAGEGAVVAQCRNHKEILRRWLRFATGNGEKHRVVATPGMLKLIGIGVVHVKPGRGDSTPGR